MKIQNIKSARIKNSDRDNKVPFTKIMGLWASGNKNALHKILESQCLIKRERL